MVQSFVEVEYGRYGTTRGLPEDFRLFDAIIDNADRVDRNVFVAEGARAVALDHGHAFDFTPRVEINTAFGARSETLRRLSAISRSQLQAALQPHLNKASIDRIWLRIRSYLRLREPSDSNPVSRSVHDELYEFGVRQNPRR